jgi:hypothetical protein
VDIELHQAIVAHFQQEGLASFLIHDIGAFHDFVHFERLRSALRIFSRSFSTVRSYSHQVR